MANKILKTLTLPNAQGEPVTYELYPDWKNIENKPEGFTNILNTTTTDNGKFLRVIDGVPAWDFVPNAEEVAF